MLTLSKLFNLRQWSTSVSQAGNVIVPVRNNFLSPRFRRLVGVKQYHNFHFSTSFHGVAKLLWKMNSSFEGSTLEARCRRSSLGAQAVSKIREFCREDTRDLVCPNISQASVPDTSAPVTPSHHTNKSSTLNTLSYSPPHPRTFTCLLSLSLCPYPLTQIISRECSLSLLLESQGFTLARASVELQTFQPCLSTMEGVR